MMNFKIVTLNLCLGLKNKKRFSEEYFVARENKCVITTRDRDRKFIKQKHTQNTTFQPRIRN